jgi:hypothetical protein
MIKVGAGEADITPPLGTSMAGLAHDRKAEGVHDKIFARAMVLDDGSTKVAFVTCDLLSIKRRTILSARAIVEKKLGIPGRNVMISATHSHSGPQTTNLFSIRADEDYVKALPEKIAGAVGKAAEKATEARVGIGSVNEYRLSYNRRFIMRDGTSECQPEKGSDQILWNEGPIDPQVGVLFAEDMKGKTIGVLVNFTCHPTVTLTKALISADYPGYIDPVIRKAKGDDVVILFANGAFGNMNHVDYSNPNTSEFGYEWAGWMGKELAKDALRAMEATKISTEYKLGSRSKIIKIPIREIFDRDLKKAKEISDGAILPMTSPMPQSERRGGMTASFLDHPYWGKMWSREIVLLAEEKQKNPTVDVEVQAISVGNAAFVGVPAEYFVEFGLEMKEKSKIRPTFLVGMSNGCVGYVPTLRAFKGGGYEPKTACSSKLVPEAGQMVLDIALGLLNEA